MFWPKYLPESRSENEASRPRDEKNEQLGKAAIRTAIHGVFLKKGKKTLLLVAKTREFF